MSRIRPRHTFTVLDRDKYKTIELDPLTSSLKVVGNRLGLDGDDLYGSDESITIEPGMVYSILEDGSRGWVEASVGVSEWQPDTPYAEGVLVTHDGSLYIALTDTEDEPPSGDWNEVLTGGLTWAGVWSAGTYPANSVVVHQGLIYIAKVETSESPSNFSVDWDVLANPYLTGSPDDIVFVNIPQTTTYSDLTNEVARLPVSLAKDGTDYDGPSIDFQYDNAAVVLRPTLKGEDLENVPPANHHYGTDAEGERGWQQDLIYIGSNGHKTIRGIPEFGLEENDLSILIGYNSSATGDGSVVIGNTAHAEGEHGVAIGSNAYAEGEHGVAIGYYANARGYDGVAIGYNAHAEEEHGVAIGSNAYAEGEHGVAIGSNAYAEGEHGVAIGKEARAIDPDDGEIAVVNLRIKPPADNPSDASTLTLMDTNGDPHVIAVEEDGHLSVNGNPIATEWYGTQAQYDGLGSEKETNGVKHFIEAE